MNIDTSEQFTCQALIGSHCFRSECPVCLGEHDEEIHAATVRLRTWFRETVTQYLDAELPFAV